MKKTKRTASAKELTISRRNLLKGALVLGAGAAVGGCVTGTRISQLKAKTEHSSDLVRRENEQPGTRDWLLGNSRIDPQTKYRSPWIEGYCSRTSVRAGQTISFHVSTNPASSFTLEIYRMGYYGGAGGRHLLGLGPFLGQSQLEPPIGANRLRECQWEPCATIKIPADWLSGVYLGKLTAERIGLQSYVIFVVRDERNADFIFQCSDTTWQAYNRWPSQFARGLSSDVFALVRKRSGALS